MVFVSRNTLAFPFGVKAGFDPSHFAARNIVRFSGIACGTGFLSLLTGKAGTASGAPTTTVDGALGLCQTFPASSARNFANQPAVADTQFTIAVLFRHSAITTNQGYFANSSTNNVGNTLFNGTGPITIKIAATSNTVAFSNTSFVTANVPHFLAVSVNGTKANAFVVRLNTGQYDFAENFTVAGSSGASTGTYVVGNTPSLAAACIGNIAAVMYSTAFLSMFELEEWASDPWSFWYPDAAEDSFVGVTAAAGNPFVQSDWPLPRSDEGNRNPPLRNWVQGINLNLIAQDQQFAGAGQFKTYDWPLPGRQPERSDLRSWAFTYNQNLVGLDALPNRQDDWPLSARQFTYRGEQPDLRSWIGSYNKNLIGLDALPTRQQDWPLSSRHPSYANERPDLRSWAFTYNPNLIGKDVLPFNQDDWPLASRIQYRWERPDLQSWSFTYNPNLIGKDTLPFRQTDWPLPRRQDPSLPTWIFGLQLPLLPTGQSPFVQSDWPNPTGIAWPLSLRSWSITYNPNLLGKDTFYGAAGQGVPNFDWPNPRGKPERSDLRTWTFTYNPNLVGQDALPFRQGDWPLSLPPIPPYVTTLRTWSATYNPNLIGKDSLPFRQSDWPLPRPPAPAAIGWTFGFSQVINLSGQNPFVQSDWPLPGRQPERSDLRTWANWYNLNLIGKDQFFGLAGNPTTDWPNPPRVPSRVHVQFVISPFIPSIPVPPPPPVFPPTSRIIAIDCAYGSDGLARTIIQTPAPIVHVGEAALLLITVSPWVPLNFGFAVAVTKPDGTVVTLTPPDVYVGTASIATWVGTFEPDVYLIVRLFPSTLDQFGGYTAQVVQGSSVGPVGRFTIFQ
jgi:hypothetical protein